MGHRAKMHAHAQISLIINGNGKIKMCFKSKYDLVSCWFFAMGKKRIIRAEIEE